MNVLVTGGAGYIGSHAALHLLEAGHHVAVVDDLSRGRQGAIDALCAVGQFHFTQGTIADRDLLSRVMREQHVDAVMHFAAFADVNESVAEPLLYYRNNLGGTIALLDAIDAVGVTRLVFSSTCATYGEPADEHVPIAEDCPQKPINPYGHSKLFVERILLDYARRKRDRGEDFALAALRYFNVAGNDPAARLGEDHTPEPHLLPICLDAALGQRDDLTIFGTDYPTPDGTCIRDYVHVDDLIDAHMTVMGVLTRGDERVYNIGIGRGYSVREVLDSCRRVTGVDIKATDGARRPGDPPSLYAVPDRIRRELGWTAAYTELDAIVETAWRWRQDHPQGYPR